VQTEWSLGPTLGVTCLLLYDRLSGSVLCLSWPVTTRATRLLAHAPGRSGR
jgi:hypothetical protein